MLVQHSSNIHYPRTTRTQLPISISERIPQCRNHFNGQVTYSSEGFLVRISLLRGIAGTASDGAEGAGSMNLFVKGLFSGKAIATQTYTKDEDTIVAA